MGAPDLAIVVAYLLSVIAVGAWFSRRQKTIRQYFQGGGNVPWWAVSASIVATETSTVTFLSIPGAAYARGGNFTFLQLALGYVAGRVIISMRFIPLYFKGELLTVYQLLTGRFGEGVKGVIAGLFIAMRTAADGVRLLLTATVLVAVWRAFEPEADAGRVTVGASIALGGVMILFTLWGGVEAVIWIEVAQLCIYIVGAVAAAYLLSSALSERGVDVPSLASQFDKTRLLNFELTLDKAAGHTFWSGLIGGCFLNMSTHGTDQYLVQRYLCVKGPKKAAAALLVSGIVVFAQFTLFLYIGVLLFAYYAPHAGAGYLTGPSAAPFVKVDEVFTDFITKHLPTGVGGFVVAAILAAALSSSLNSIAATAVNDLWRPFTKPKSDADWLRRSKVLTVAAGVLQVAVALAARYSNQSALDSVLAVAGLANGPVLGIFLLGFLVPKAGRAAAIVGLTAGVAAALSIWQLTNVFWPWYTAAGALSTLAAGASATLAFDSLERKS